MIISYYGHSCFKIETKPGGRGAGERLNIYIDPFEAGIGLKPPSGKADLVLVTHQHTDHNNIKALRGDYFLVQHPGEYAYRGISITGIKTFHDAAQGQERGTNTAYVLETEDIRICHLGDLGHKLEKSDIEAFEGIDILMIPVGGSYTIGAKEAAETVRLLEPSMVIPMHYNVPGLTVDIAGPDAFYEELGHKPEGKTAKLVLKKNQLKEGEMGVVELAVGNGNSGS